MWNTGPCMQNRPDAPLPPYPQAYPFMRGFLKGSLLPQSSAMTACPRPRASSVSADVSGPASWNPGSAGSADASSPSKSVCTAASRRCMEQGLMILALALQ